MKKFDMRAELRNSSFFGKVSDDLIERVARISKVEQYSKSHLIFADETPCLGMYIVVSGAIKIYKIGTDGREHVLHVAEKGDTFGEAAMFLGSQGYPAYAGVVKNSSVIFIPKRQMLEILESDPSFCMQILGSLAMWTHRLVAKLESLALKDASSRLARYILERGNQGKEIVELTIPKHTLASHLAISSETLSRLLTRFEAEDLIESEGRVIKILDRDELESVSEWGTGE